MSLSHYGSQEEKLAVSVTNTALGPKTEVLCVGPASKEGTGLQSQMGHLPHLAQALAGVGSTQGAGLTGSRASGAAAVTGVT